MHRPDKKEDRHDIGQTHCHCCFPSGGMRLACRPGLVCCAVCCVSVQERRAGLGIILPISILVSNIPQICVAAREEDLTDLSFGTWVLSMSDGLVWGLYSVIEQDFSIMVFTLFQLMTSGAIVFLKFLNQKKRHAEV